MRIQSFSPQSIAAINKPTSQVRFMAQEADLSVRRKELENLKIKQFFTKLFRDNGLMAGDKTHVYVLNPQADSNSNASRLIIDMGSPYTCENSDLYLAALIALPSLELLPGAATSPARGIAFKLNTASIPELAGLGSREIMGEFDEEVPVW